MQSSILCPVEIQKRHSATVHIFAVLILIWKLKFPGIFCQMLAQVFDLKLKTEIFPVLLCRKFLYDLLNGTGVTSVICKEKFRTGSQHIILIQQSITVHAARKFIALCRDVLKDLNIHLLLRCRFFHLCPILVNVHVFVRKTEQLSHSTAVEITRQCVTCRITDRHFRIFAGVFCRMIPDILKTFPNTIVVKSLKDSYKLITAVTPCKKFLRDSLAKLYCKRTDVFVTFVMTKIIVDHSQIIQVKYAHRNQFICRDRIWSIKDLLTFILVRKPGCFIEVDFFLKDPVLCGKTDCLDKFCSDDQNQAQDIRQNYFFQFIQGCGFFLGINFRVADRLVTNLEKMLALRNNIGVLVTFFPDKEKFTSEFFFKTLCKLVHLVLKILIRKTHKIQLVTSIAQSFNIGRDRLIHLILRLPGNLQLDHTLRAAAHQSRIVNDTGRSLDLAHHRHDHKK